MKILTYTEKIAYFTSKKFMQISIGIVIAMVAITVIDVFLRFFFNKPIKGAIEIVVYMILTLSLFGLVWCTMQKKHIKVDILSSYIPKRVQTIFETIFYVFGLALYSFICWSNFMQIGVSLGKGKTSIVLNIPAAPFFLIISVTTGLVALISIIFAIKNIIGEEKI